MILNMKNLLSTLTLLLAVTFGQAATVYTATSTGVVNWSSITWSVTGSGTPVTRIIPSGLTATINANVTTEDTLKILGVLDFKSNVTLTLNTDGYVEILPGGTVTGGSGNSEIIFGTTGTITGPYNGAGIYAGPSYAHKITGTFVTGTALPVTWSSFTAATTNNTIQLKWSTASELNNSHFDIERASADGQFHTIGSVNGNGTTQAISNYLFTDTEPLNAVAYYRIKQTDFNGDFDYSITIKVDGKTTTPISVWPTLLKDNNTTIKINNISENASIHLIDATGKEVNGLNSLATASETVTLSLQNGHNNLSGFYFLYITDNNKTTSFKILVQ